MDIGGIEIVEGPGIKIVPTETLVATDKPTFTIAWDEDYVTRVLGEKFGLQVKPR